MWFVFLAMQASMEELHRMLADRDLATGEKAEAAVAYAGMWGGTGSRAVEVAARPVEKRRLVRSPGSSPESPLPAPRPAGGMGLSRLAYIPRQLPHSPPPRLDRVAPRLPGWFRSGGEAEAVTVLRHMAVAGKEALQVLVEQAGRGHISPPTLSLMAELQSSSERLLRVICVQHSEEAEVACLAHFGAMGLSTMGAEMGQLLGGRLALAKQRFTVAAPTARVLEVATLFDQELLKAQEEVLTLTQASAANQQLAQAIQAMGRGPAGGGGVRSGARNSDSGVGQAREAGGGGRSSDPGSSRGHGGHPNRGNNNCFGFLETGVCPRPRACRFDHPPHLAGNRPPPPQ